MQKDALPVKGSLPSEKRLFLHAGHGREQNISTKMKLFLIKQLQRIMNVSVTLSDPEKTQKKRGLWFRFHVFLFYMDYILNTANIKHLLSDVPYNSAVGVFFL